MDQQRNIINGRLSDFFMEGGAPLMNFVLLMVGSWKTHQQKLSVGWGCNIFFLGCSGTSLLLTIIGYCLGSCGPPSIWIRRCTVAYISTILRMFAAAALLLLFDISHAVVAGTLLLPLLTILICSYCKTIPDRAVTTISWTEPQIQKLNILFSISCEVVSIAFACLSGTLLGYVKGTWNLIRGYRAPECYVFCSLVLGLVVVLLSSVPPIPRATYSSRIRGPIASSRIRRSIANTYLPMLTYASLVFLVLASVMAAQEIVGEYVFIAFFVVAVGFMICFGFVLYYEVGMARHNNMGPGTWEKWVVPSVTVCFTALMAAHAAYGTGAYSSASLSRWFKGLVVSALCTITIYGIRTVVSAETSGAGHPIVPTNPWDRMAYCSLACNLIFAVIVGIRQLDAFKKIFR